MDLSSINPALLLASLLVAATPILLAAIGELVVERSGVLNLGVEGMMITGAICGFAVSVETGSPALGFLLAALGGAVLALLFALLTQFALANQVASGLALTLFGLGLSSLMGQGYVGIKPPPTPKLDIPVLSDLPFIGRVVFSHDLMVYFALALVSAVWATLKYTRVGLILRAVGENHDAAHGTPESPIDKPTTGTARRARFDVWPHLVAPPNVVASVNLGLLAVTFRFVQDRLARDARCI